MAFLGDSGLHVTLSIGVALYGPHGTSFDDLLRRQTRRSIMRRRTGKISTSSTKRPWKTMPTCM